MIYHSMSVIVLALATIWVIANVAGLLADSGAWREARQIFFESLVIVYILGSIGGE